MKLEFLASLLEKDALELQDTLNLEEGLNEVSEDIAKELINNHIKEVAISKLSEGKKQAEGMAKKKVLSEAEKKLKDKFDITGSNYEEMIEALYEKIASQSDNTGDTLKKEKEALRVKISDLEEKLQSQQAEFEKLINQRTIVEKLDPLLNKYEFATDKVKQLAISDYINNRNFIVSDGDLFLDIDGKPTAYIDADLERHMLQFATLKQTQIKKPASVDISSDSSSFGETISDLLKALRTAPVEERPAIKQKIKQLEQKI